MELAAESMTDGLDLSTAQIHNSPDVRGWPATAQITKLEFRPTGVHVEHTKNLGPGAWPNFRPAGWDGDLQFTLWIFLSIGGTWHGSGCIQFWQTCEQNGGPPEQFAKNWYYAADRWAPMTGHQPAPGDLVGFMVTAGDARNSGAQSVQERSQVVVLPFPRSGDVYVPPVSPAPPAPVPVPIPDPNAPDNPLSIKLAQMLDLYNQLLASSKDMSARLLAVEERQGIEQEHGWKGYAEVNLGFTRVKAPVTVTERIP